VLGRRFDDLHAVLDVVQEILLRCPIDVLSHMVLMMRRNETTCLVYGVHST
jgi:hypothetical protein